MVSHVGEGSIVFDERNGAARFIVEGGLRPMFAPKIQPAGDSSNADKNKNLARGDNDKGCDLRGARGSCHSDYLRRLFALDFPEPALIGPAFRPSTKVRRIMPTTRAASATL